jgi:hypothetical protein
MSECIIEGCLNASAARGWCSMHYQRWLRHGDPAHAKPRVARCSEEGCERKHYGRGMCHMHYTRARKNLMPVCTVDGCTTPQLLLNKGLCPKHLNRLQRHGDVNTVLRKRGVTCEVPGCNKPHNAHGLCNAHYVFCKRKGVGISPDSIRELEVGAALETLERYGMVDNLRQVG